MVGRNDVADFAQRVALQNDIRKTLASAIAGTLFLATAYFAWRQVLNAGHQLLLQQHQVEITRDEQLAGRLYRSFEYLGHDNLNVRIGAMFTLERLVRASPEDTRAVLEVLAAYVRTRSPWPPKLPGQYIESADIDDVPPMQTRSPDIQLALDVIGRLNSGGSDIRLSLAESDLRQASLNGGDFSDIDFDSSSLARVTAYEAKLNRASLQEVDLRGAHFDSAEMHLCWLRDVLTDESTGVSGDLTGSDLNHAKFQHVDFRGSSMARVRATGVDFSGAFLDGVSFSGAELDGTNFAQASLRGTDISSATFYGPCDFRLSAYDKETVFPGGFSSDKAGMTLAPLEPNTMIFNAKQIVRVMAPWEVHGGE
ncbi:Uncharacterized protein YjbI, contains pentapeptide repeats [Micromonospora rifamycinica]|uniref:Uncharacterized protein YjbI, contains pentapeptide repeats n=2 Tax=Micromonospora rifamycinica TaxID=291594 RepID=A0A1C5GVJ2_9ACTN|nr:Uncharacterized protein YjbI, contains pentapeptide repeats [Micromonospora rifamycinica]